MKKKLVAATLTASMILSMGVAAVPVMAKDDGEPYKAALLLNGTLGDKSFFDSANSGMEGRTWRRQVHLQSRTDGCYICRRGKMGADNV